LPKWTEVGFLYHILFEITVKEKGHFIPVIPNE